MNSNAEFNTISELDLDPIKVKLMDKETGEGWSRQQADAVAFEYRRFLCLTKLFPHEQMAPRLDIDIFWHCHILDTMKYAADCAKIFGYFLHHVPDSGLRGEDDEAAHHSNGARMQALYEATFGEAYLRHEDSPATTAWCSPEAAKTAWCSPEAAKTAWCSPEAAKTAWCSPEAVKSAWCSPATGKTAWCSPATAKTAWCSPARMSSPWVQGTTATTAYRMAAAQNDFFYSQQALAIAA